METETKHCESCSALREQLERERALSEETGRQCLSLRAHQVELWKKINGDELRKHMIAANKAAQRLAEEKDILKLKMEVALDQLAKSRRELELIFGMKAVSIGKGLLPKESGWDIRLWSNSGFGRGKGETFSDALASAVGRLAFSEPPTASHVTPISPPQKQK